MKKVVKRSLFDFYLRQFNNRLYSAARQPNYRKHYETLGLSDNADQEAVRRAFVALCKQFHPDSGNANASSQKFNEIETAYRALQTKFSNERWAVEEKGIEVEQFDIRHTAPQHREYLSYDGFGSGTPSQRQQQYTQRRAAKAAASVLQHRIDRLEQRGTELTTKDRNRVKNIKTRFGMDRVVEDLIQESMAKGEFTNLSGSGKPLKDNNFNHHVDFVTRKINEILIDNGFQPEWISLRKEISEDLAAFREDLRIRTKFRTDPGKWQKVLERADEKVKAINKKIEFLNLIVPILNQQKLLVRLDKEVEKALAAAPKAVDVEKERESYEPPRDKSVLGFVFSLFDSK